MNYQNKQYKDYIEDIIKNHKIIVFMKGEKLTPMCGFSNTVVQIFNHFGISYHTVNVLNDERLRNEIKLYSKWPTIPQIYINGEFIGGADIILNLYKENQLKEILEKTLNS